MALRYLLDENLLGGGLWQALLQHNSLGLNPVDVVRVGDPADLPKGTKDPDLLTWCEREGRILLSLDRSTLPRHLALHLQAGGQSPGIFFIVTGNTIPQIVAALVVVCHAGDPGYYQDRIDYIL